MKVPLSKIRVKNFDQVAHLHMPQGVDLLTRDQVEYELVYSAYCRGVKRRLALVTHEPYKQFSRIVVSCILNRLAFIDLSEIPQEIQQIMDDYDLVFSPYSSILRKEDLDHA